MMLAIARITELLKISVENLDGIKLNDIVRRDGKDWKVVAIQPPDCVFLWRECEQDD